MNLRAKNGINVKGLQKGGRRETLHQRNVQKHVSPNRTSNLGYCDLLNRKNIQQLCGKTSITLAEFLDDFASICLPVDVWFLWRPNLKDEADNHIIELGNP
jgi:hypothetical protein